MTPTKKTNEIITRKRSFGNLGLKPEEDERLEKMLRARDISLGQLQRALIREWVSKGGPGFVLSSK